METKKIRWQCNASPNWEWLYFEGATVPVGNDGVRGGEIDLSSQAGDWWPCAELVLQHGANGHALVRYFKDDHGVDQLQARVVADGSWDHPGPIAGPGGTSQAGATSGGGFYLTASYV